MRPAERVSNTAALPSGTLVHMEDEETRRDEEGNTPPSSQSPCLAVAGVNTITGSNSGTCPRTFVIKQERARPNLFCPGVTNRRWKILIA